MFKSLSVLFVTAAMVVLPLSAQSSDSAADFKALYQKHLKTSEEFTVKVAEAMPAENYDFKLTSGQMSFGGQMTHIAQGLAVFGSRLEQQKATLGKPKSGSKEDVISFLKAGFETIEAEVAKLTPEQIAHSYKTGATTSQTGYEILLGALDHTTNHRASAEMYLRTKGIVPPVYEF